MRIPPIWALPESSATPEAHVHGRRAFLRASGIAGIGASLGACGLSVDGYQEAGPARRAESLAEVFPAVANPAFPHPDTVTAEEAAALRPPPRALTAEQAALTYNNYYEFTTSKEGVWRAVGAFQPEPWTLEITGACHNPVTLDLDGVARAFAFEERVYRHRCVERWAMTVPWTGFPLADLVALADPLGSARYVRFTSLSRPAEMPGVEAYTFLPWPYYEGLRLDEARNPLAFVVVGLYGKQLAAQNGAPIRLVCPWKYGYKSPKAIVRVEFLEDEPATFWNTVVPAEYGFFSNVDPERPHPRWPQHTEYLIPNRDAVATLPYNGYGEVVASLYDGTEY